MMKSIEKNMNTIVQDIQESLDTEFMNIDANAEETERVIDEKDYEKWIRGKSFSLQKRRSAS